MTMLEQTDVSIWQDFFTSIIEDADSNILVLDDDCRVLTLNPGFYWVFLETYGIELKKGSSILESMAAVNPTLTEIWKERCDTVMSGMPIKVEDVFELEGRKYYWEIHFKSTTLADSRQIISVFSRDSTVRKAYQKRILENEANLRSILNTIDDSVWLVNTDYELIDFNKAFYRSYKTAFGVRLARGKNILDLIPDYLTQMRAMWRERYEAGLKGRPGRFYDSYWLEKELKTYEIKTYPIVENGKVTGLTIYSRDITLQKKTEDLLKEQNQELTKINSELDRFVYSASHDLRAPLMSVKGLLNMIKVDPEKRNTDQYLQLIETSVDKLDHFITEIIHYSRNSRMEIVPKLIDFKSIVEESIQSLKYMDEAEQVQSKININSNQEFYSDAGRLLIIFNNLISNSVRYRDKWKDSFVRIDISVNKDSAIVRISDNGIGIADEFKDKIFKMFFRATADSKGSGLGLYIVKSTVEKLEGSIHMSSKLGEGTSFEIEIPNLKASVLN
jgi:PAS domain S-box-containing protein